MGKLKLLLIATLSMTILLVCTSYITTFRESRRGEAGELLTLMNVDWSNSSRIVVEVMNTGTEDATIDSVYFGTRKTQLTKLSSVAFDPSSVVEKDGGKTTLTILCPWTADQTYYFKVVTKSGFILEFHEETK